MIFWNEVFLGPHSRHHLFTRAICHKNQIQARKGNKFYTQNPHAARRLFCNVALGRDESGKINFLLFHGWDQVWQEDLPGDESPWADIDGLVPFPFFRPVFVLSRKISFFPRYSFFDFGTFAPPYIYIFFMSLSNLAKLQNFTKIKKNLKSPHSNFPPFPRISTLYDTVSPSFFTIFTQVLLLYIPNPTILHILSPPLTPNPFVIPRSSYGFMYGRDFSSQKHPPKKLTLSDVPWVRERRKQNTSLNIYCFFSIFFDFFSPYCHKFKNICIFFLLSLKYNLNVYL